MRPGKLAGRVYAGLVYAALYFPLLIVIVFSFNDAKRNLIWKGFTVKWYGTLFADAELVAALWTSLKVAVTASLIATLMGLLASYVLIHHARLRAKRAYDSALSVPLMVPEIILGVGLLSLYTRVRFDLSFWGLVCAHVVYCLPFVVWVVKARISSLKGHSVEEAAMDLGATEWQAFYKITLPLAWPAILAGGMLAFTVSFEDFVTSFFVAGVGTTTLPIKIYSMMKFGITPEINAMSTILLVLTLLLVAAYYFLNTDENQDQLPV